MLGELPAILEKTLQCHEELLRLAEKKRAVILAGEVDQLRNLAQEETALMREMAEVEQARIKAVRRIVPAERDARDVTLRDIVAQCDEGERSRLTAMMGQLQSVMDRLKQENTMNQSLIDESLQYVGHTLHVLTTQMTEDYMYYPGQTKAKEQKGTMSGLFDRKA